MLAKGEALSQHNHVPLWRDTHQKKTYSQCVSGQFLVADDFQGPLLARVVVQEQFGAYLGRIYTGRSKCLKVQQISVHFYGKRKDIGGRYSIEGGLH